MTSESPFKGLASFDDSELDALLFFGRDRERETIVANVLANRLTVLYGSSGVGKSSLLRRRRRAEPARARSRRGRRSRRLGGGPGRVLARRDSPRRPRSSARPPGSGTRSPRPHTPPARSTCCSTSSRRPFAIPRREPIVDEAARAAPPARPSCLGPDRAAGRRARRARRPSRPRFRMRSGTFCGSSRSTARAARDAIVEPARALRRAHGCAASTQSQSSSRRYWPRSATAITSRRRSCSSCWNGSGPRSRSRAPTGCTLETLSRLGGVRGDRADPRPGQPRGASRTPTRMPRRASSVSSSLPRAGSSRYPEADLAALADVAAGNAARRSSRRSNATRILRGVDGSGGSPRDRDLPRRSRRAAARLAAGVRARARAAQGPPRASAAVDDRAAAVLVALAVVTGLAVFASHPAKRLACRGAQGAGPRAGRACARGPLLEAGSEPAKRVAGGAARTGRGGRVDATREPARAPRGARLPAGR